MNTLNANIARYAAKRKCSIKQALKGVWGRKGRSKWLMLGRDINRSTQSVKTKVFSLYGERKARPVKDHGKNHDRNRQFSLAEDSRLVAALEGAKAICGNKVVDSVKVSWRKISDKVKTRTGPSCRQRWVTYLSKQPGFMDVPLCFGPRKVWKMAKLVRDYVITNGIEDFIDIPWEDVLLKTGVPLFPHEISKKFQAHLGANFKRCRRYSFKRKIQRLGRTRNIRKIPPGVTHWSDEYFS